MKASVELRLPRVARKAIYGFSLLGSAALVLAGSLPLHQHNRAILPWVDSIHAVDNGRAFVIVSLVLISCLPSLALIRRGARLDFKTALLAASTWATAFLVLGAHALLLGSHVRSVELAAERQQYLPFLSDFAAGHAVPSARAPVPSFAGVIAAADSSAVAVLFLIDAHIKDGDLYTAADVASRALHSTGYTRPERCQIASALSDALNLDGFPRPSSRKERAFRPVDEQANDIAFSRICAGGVTTWVANAFESLGNVTLGNLLAMYGKTTPIETGERS